jgi:hypothetical protein
LKTAEAVQTPCDGNTRLKPGANDWMADGTRTEMRRQKNKRTAGFLQPSFVK